MKAEEAPSMMLTEIRKGWTPEGIQQGTQQGLCWGNGGLFSVQARSGRRSNQK